MKLLYITCSVSMQERIETLLRKHNPQSIQVIPKVLSESQTGTPRRDDPIWPGYDVAFMVHAEDGIAEKIFSALRNLNERSYDESELVTGTMLNVTDSLLSEGR